MARGYNATLDVKCWKEHACCYCGAAYRYLLKKKQSGYGATQPDAVGAARATAVRSLRSAVEMMPCPSCGHYQPDMIGGRRLVRHSVVLFATLAVFVSLFLLRGCHVLPAPAALWLLVFSVVPLWIAYTWIGWRHPNGSMREQGGCGPARRTETPRVGDRRKGAG